MESFQEKLTRLRGEQAARDAARNPEQPQPAVRTPQQLFRDLRTADETRRQIRAEVAEMSDRNKPNPIRTYRDELKAKLRYAPPSERSRITSRLEVLDAELARHEAAEQEAKRLESFAAHPAVVNMREAASVTLRNASTLYPAVDSTKFQKLKAVSESNDFIDPMHASRMFFGLLSEIENEQFQADQKRHTEALAETGKSFSTLNSAEAAAAASKARLEAAQKALGGDNVQPATE
jgi:hypothetical protein